MCDFLIMTIRETFHKLLEVVPSKRFIECAGSGNKIKEFTSEGKLQNDEGNSLCFTIVFNIVGSTIFNLMYYVRMLELLHHFDFGIKKFNDFGICVITHDFDSNLSSGVDILS